MRIALFLVLILVHVVKVSAQKETSVNTISDEVIQEWLIENKVPAMAIGTIEDGKLNKVAVHGSIPDDSSPAPSTLFDVASLTKTITTLLALKLVQTDNWDLDEPVYQYWIDPEIENNPFTEKLTTRHILSHRTGFKNWRWMNEDKKLAFDFEPGTQFQYSGEGFEYLRKSMESKFDVPFEKLVDSLVFKPYRMHDSYLTWNENIDIQNFAGTYDKDGNQYEYEKSVQANAADNLLTTVEDLTNLGANIINKKYMDEGVYEEMMRPHSNVREGIDFGLGWIVFNGLPNNEYALFNAGSDTGVNALMVLLPNSKRGLVVMTNGDNGRGLAMRLIGASLGEVGGEILNRF